MKSNLPSLLRCTAIFLIGFAVAWLIRTPPEINARRNGEMVAIPESRFRAIEKTKSVGTIPEPRAISRPSQEAEATNIEVNNQLLDSQVRLAKARESAFNGNSDLSYAYEAWRTYQGWQQSMGPLTSEALGWWNNQNDPAVRSAMREVTRKLMVQELAARLSDPASREWVIAWSDKAYANTESGIQERQKWWSDNFVSLPNFHTLPPPDVLASLLDPTTLPATLERFQITDVERQRIKPSIFFYLEGSAQAAVISNGGKAYYDRKKGSGIASLESEVETNNRRASSVSNHAGNPK